MSTSAPILPTRLEKPEDYGLLKQALDEYFFRLQNAQDTVPAGAVVIWPGDAALIPQGWVACDGEEYSQAKYPMLYKAIGSEYPSGNAGTFLVPNETPTDFGIYIIKV